MSKIIKVKNLTKIYKIPKKSENLNKTKKLFSWVYREWEDKPAVVDVNFEIEKGEIIGYLGPNGAGKSTTIKMLTGILYPTSGDMSIFFDDKKLHPQKNRNEYTKDIGVVFGQRSILAYDIPVKDSFRLFKAIYGLSEEFYNERLKYLVELLEVDKFFETPYRMLSLGEKMRCELAASFLHAPKIVFLDEPTIGLDAKAKITIRNFLKEINKKENTTIILTTHDMDDIEELCRRIILIDNGEKKYDGDLKEFIEKYASKKRISVYFSKCKNDKKLNELYKKFGSSKLDNKNYVFKVNRKKQIGDFLKQIVEVVEIIDLSVEDERLENIIARVYEENK